MEANKLKKVEKSSTDVEKAEDGISMHIKETKPGRFKIVGNYLSEGLAGDKLKKSEKQSNYES